MSGSNHGYGWSVDTLDEFNDANLYNSLVGDFVYDAVFRTTLDKPGFALITFAGEIDSAGLREAMTALVRGLSKRNGDDPLTVQSAQRFDQQNTTRFHLDNGPDESYLLLGYEPSPVSSELAVADYARAAFDLGISPTEYLDRYNPMFAGNAERLVPYTTRLDLFDSRSAQLLIINNSRLPFDAGGRNRLGVLHQATIPAPIPAETRVINSVQIAPASQASEKVSSAEWETFLGEDMIQMVGQ